MKSGNYIKLGGAIFFIGCIFILISWLYTYPVYMSDVNQVTFFQFFPLLWPGIALCLMGIFIVTYSSKNKIIQAIMCSFIPILLEIHVYFYTYLPSSDSGAARGMFHIFQQTGLNFEPISYFEFPNYFILNEILRLLTNLDEKGIAFISFSLYGILLSLILFLFFYDQKKLSSQPIIPSLLVLIYFIGMYSLLNYQWVPQTLALVQFFLLLLISSYILTNKYHIKWKFLLIVVFTSLVYTHAFIPVIFLAFFVIILFKKRNLTPVFLLIVSIYCVNTLYYTISNLELYINAFKQSIQGFGGEYAKTVTGSFRNTADPSIFNRMFSLFNGVKFAAIWGITFLGSIVIFIKRKLNIFLIALGLSGVVYIGTGFFFSIFGLRATQILFIPLTIGFIFFLNKWKKLTVLIIAGIIILAVFGPMRSAYDQTAFQIDEEVYACDFLVETIKEKTNPKVGMGQVNWGYFTNKLTFFNNVNSEYYAIRPGSSRFLGVFNTSMDQNDYILYNENLGKEIITYRMTKEDLILTLDTLLASKNKIYSSYKSFIINGIN